MQLQTKDQLMMDNAGIKKSPTTLGEIVGLHNYAVADITPQLWHDVTPQLRLDLRARCMVKLT